MRILIYESIPDITRSHFIKHLSKYLTNLGHEIFFLIDERVYFRLQRGQGDYGIIDCSGPLSYNLVKDNRSKTYVFSPTNKELTQISIDRRREEYADTISRINPDRIIVWNGIATHHKDFKQVIKNLNLTKQLYHLEMGWLPQNKYFFCDKEGVSIHSSIAKKDYSTNLDNYQKKILQKKINEFTKGDKSSLKKVILVPLQLDTDSNITQFSPYKSAQEFINVLEKWIPTGYKVLIRIHPLAINNDIKWNRNDFILDKNIKIRESLLEAKYVIGINSTSLIEAMAYGCKVMAFGQGIFSSVKGLTVTENVPFLEAKNNKIKTDTFLYELLVNKQISFKNFSGIESALELEDSATTCNQCNFTKYPLIKLYKGIFKYKLGKIAKALKII